MSFISYLNAYQLHYYYFKFWNKTIQQNVYDGETVFPLLLNTHTDKKHSFPVPKHKTNTWEFHFILLFGFLFLFATPQIEFYWLRF